MALTNRHLTKMDTDSQKKSKFTSTTIYTKEVAAYTRMVGNEINKPLAHIPIVAEMHRAVTFPFLR